MFNTYSNPNKTQTYQSTGDERRTRADDGRPAATQMASFGVLFEFNFSFEKQIISFNSFSIN